MINEALINTDQATAEPPRAITQGIGKADAAAVPLHQATAGICVRTVASRIRMGDRTSIATGQDVANDTDARDIGGLVENIKQRGRKTGDGMVMASEDTAEMGDGDPRPVGRQGQISR